MSNDLEILSGGDLQPYDAGQPVAPLSPGDNWGVTDVDLLREDHHHQSGGVKLFGESLPPGTTAQQVDAMLGQLGGAFMSDFSSLGYPNHMINAAIQFMTANATKTPYYVTPKHNFNLHGQDDYLGHAFANMVQGLNVSPRAKQQFVTACLQWLARAAQQLHKAPAGSGDQPRMAPINTDPTEQLTDAQYQQLVDHNNRVQSKTMQVLEQRWGQYTYKQNLDIAQKYLASLPAADQAHFDRWTGSFPWTHMLNTVEALTGLYNMAVGSLPKDGPGITREIAHIEAAMRQDRKAYLNNPQLQARYRTLLDMRG